MLAFSSSAPYQTPYYQDTQIDTFLADYLSPTPSPPAHRDGIEWKSAMEKVRQQMYNSTSVAVPCPAKFLSREDRKAFSKTQFNIHSDPLSTKDMQAYRQLRSENVLYRMIFCLNHCLTIDPESITRLSQGVFVCQKLKPQPVTSPTLSAMMSTSTASEFHSQAAIPINTFQFEELMQTASHAQIAASYGLSIPWLQDHGDETFVPYSYTFGVRYTSICTHGRDILFRGHLPPWCQTLFLAECQKRMPLSANDTVQGLFPFAPTVPVTFKSLADCSFVDGEPNPELTMWYERFAMELSEPDMINNERDPDTFGLTWADRRQQILQGMLYCEIPDNLALTLTSMAAMWAASQGYIV